MRRGNVFYKDRYAGQVIETPSGSYSFQYDKTYLGHNDAQPISLTLPLRADAYHCPTLFPFFDGLIPEGWLLDLTVHHWKLNPRDRMGLLLEACRDCIGAVKVIPVHEEDSHA